ncbi:aldehyde dehydrogenase [Pseudomonas sp. PDM23]|uniref:aldehyde dehydrogenase n=1 Tax=unclassified Pseudomonas TaxID=196821 RepID=UPI001786981C|nr:MULTISPECIES: aldehyde dehydrogenase [unclassified Pseudomonas]MBD9577748.1 aldehyde dehydrogenase [Pseudomonas sp. PDM23]MBD9672308.1 aldehyde dehydrogenase [Pseudomonas sp. PDM21]
MTATTRQDWSERAAALAIEGRCFIAGSYSAAQDQRSFDKSSPLDGRKLAAIARGSAADIDRAVAAARRVFDAGHWSRLAPVQRKRILIRFADLLESHAEELALLETLDMGKPIGHALATDVPGAANAIRWSAEAIDKVYGEIAATAEDQLGLVTREAVGVVGVIVPWNFPLLMASWKLGPALACGNSVVLKPSERSPLTAIRIAALACEAGIPEGVLNVVPGYGAEAGDALSRHMDVDAIAFTGSTGVAKRLMIASGQSNLKRVWTEAGGKSPNIVFADAPDLRAAATSAASAIAYNQGQVCTAGSRLLVQESVREEFLEYLREALAAWTPSDALDPASRYGALVDAQHLQSVQGYIASGLEEGARLVTGTGEGEGCYLAPVVFDGVRNDMRIAREEIFGAVLSVIAFEDAGEAVAIANDTPYGLAAALWTSSLSRAHQVSRALRAGSVWVNQYSGGDMTAPFGGFKQSGNGRDRSLHAFDKYTELKATWIRL